LTLPNFLVIGAAKCGTDALCKFLGQHPQIFMCPNREPNFFVAEGQSEVPYQGPGDREAFESNDMWVSARDRYERLFAGVADQKAIGEGTAWYLYFESAALRIKHYVADAKLIAVLRNPIDRAYSAYTMLLGDGRESIFDFAQALAAEPERTLRNWDPLFRYIDMGFYARQLQRYREVFAPHQMRVYLYEDFNSRPRDVLQDIFQFLDVDDGFEPDTSVRHNVSMVPRNYFLHSAVAGDSRVKQALKRVLPTQARRRMKHLVLEPNLRRPAPQSPETRRQLANVFRADVTALERMLDRDLSAWLADLA
jgi:hypothetical protein